MPACNYIFIISIRVLFLLILFKSFISLTKLNSSVICNYVSGIITVIHLH